MLGALLEVEMSKNCMPLWLEAFPKTMAGVGTLEEDLQRCIFRGRRSTRDMFIRAVRRSGR